MTVKEAIEIFTKSEKCSTDDCPVTAGCDICPYNVSSEEYEEAIKMAITALKNFPTQMSGTSANNSEIPNSSDLISRQAAIDAMEKYEKRVETAGQSWTIMCCENEILSLPSAQPERKTGHWIEHKTQIADHTVYTYECSECGNSMIVKPTRFCGHCGAKMEEKTDGDM